VQKLLTINQIRVEKCRIRMFHAGDLRGVLHVIFARSDGAFQRTKHPSATPKRRHINELRLEQLAGFCTDGHQCFLEWRSITAFVYGVEQTRY
jgi:hypothetical protein